MAGLIALVQTDIKRVIAYSTMSQIGYMFLGVGVGAYSNGMFHLLTHAFFKALLFLAAGIVIHALDRRAGHAQHGRAAQADRRLTYWFFIVGALSLVGIPPFAGFFSKDSILAATLARGTFGAILWIFGVAGAFLTGRLHVPDALPRLLGRAERVRAGALPPAPRQGRRRTRCSGRSRSSPCSPTFGGWIQFAPFWTPISKFLAVSAPPLVDPSGTQELVSSIFAVLFGLVGIGGRVGDLRRSSRRRYHASRSCSGCSSTSSGSTSSTTRSSTKPGRVDSRARWNRWIERPLILGSGTERRARDAAGRPRRRPLADRSCSARTRSRSQEGSPSSSSSSSRCADVDSWLVDDPDLPARRRRARVLRASRSAAAPSRRSARSSRSSRSASGSTRSRASTSRRGCSSSSRRRGSATCNVSYHVGMYGFSLWLVGLTVVVMAAAIAYAFLAGRDRPRAYYGLMLMLIGAIVGVFTAQDLFLFYVMFEAMLIPLYVLVGVWGGAGRLGATFKFVAYTMAGSLLMLVSIIALGLTKGTFDLVDSGTSWLELDLPRLRGRVRGQGSALPLPRLAARRVPRGVAGGRRPCSAASCRRRPPTASSGSRSSSSRARRTTSGRRS